MKGWTAFVPKLKGVFGPLIALTWILLSAGIILAQPFTPSKAAAHEDHPQTVLSLNSQNGLTWDSTYFETHSYDPNGKVTETVLQEYYQGTWRNLRRISYTYGNGHLDERVTQNWDGLQWQNATRSTWQADHMGNDTMATQQQWTSLSGNFYWDTTAGDRTRFTYRPDGQVRIKELAYWQAGPSWGSWHNISRNSYHYNSQNQYDSLVYEGFISFAWTLITQLRDIQWHDYALGQMASYRQQAYSSGNWIDTQRWTCNYAGASSDCWVETNDSSVWDTAYQQISQYDSMGHLVLSERWDYLGNGQSALGQGTRKIYYYDIQGRTQDITEQIWQGGPVYRNVWKYIMGDFFVEATDVASRPIWAIYPQPAQNLLNIATGDPQGTLQFRLYDLQGRLLLSRLASPESGLFQVSVPEYLESGVYLIELAGKAGIHRQRVTILH